MTWLAWENIFNMEARLKKGRVSEQGVIYHITIIQFSSFKYKDLLSKKIKFIYLNFWVKSHVTNLQRDLVAAALVLDASLEWRAKR